MIYAKVDLTLLAHPKALAAGDAMATWTWMLLYTKEQQLDGFIPLVALRLSWSGEVASTAHARRLVEVGLLAEVDGGFTITRYAEKNWTRAQVEEKQTATRARVAKFRESRKSSPKDVSHGNADVTRYIEVRNALPAEQCNAVVPVSVSVSRSEEVRERDETPLPPAFDGRPGYFEAACDAVEMATGERLERAEAWLRYDGHRANSTKARSQRDAQYWLTSVVVKEAREGRQRERALASRTGQPAPPVAPPKAPEVRQREADKFAAAVLGGLGTGPPSAQDAPGTRFASGTGSSGGVGVKRDSGGKSDMGSGCDQ